MALPNWGKLVISLLLPQLAGLVGALFTTPNIPGWYAGLIKRELNPASWVFGPVWTTLFILMGIAMYLVWSKGLDKKGVSIALGVFIAQLALNTLWSVLFFGIQNPGAAFIEIIILWLSILATIILFKQVSQTAAWLLVPYILWVSFAAYLNYSIWILN